MKKFITLCVAAVVLVAVVCGVLAGCDPNGFASGFGTDNNGYAKNDEEVQRLISVVPNERQLEFLEMEYYNFIHFGMNTFTRKQWGTGEEDPATFNPTALDTDQWCEIIKNSGSTGVIITAKHHDGFCLWQTSTTEHSVKNSPWMNGQGDVVKMLSESCEKYGLKMGIYLSPWDMNMGIYLSPWDMNAESYGNTEAYNEFYMAQLRELLSGEYGPDFDGDGKGEIFCVWMDGARGEEVPSDFEYKMDEWEDLIWTLQPDCVSTNLGSDVRWIGNEAGNTRESEWSVVSQGNASNQEQQSSEEDADRLQEVDPSAEDIGSRELLAKYRDLVFYPAEADMVINNPNGTWFWNGSDLVKPGSTLLERYVSAVGGNASLLLNLAPNDQGLIPEATKNSLEDFKALLDATTAKPAEVSSIKIGDNKSTEEKEGLENLLNTGRDGYTFGENEYIIDIELASPIVPGRLDIREDLRSSQRVEKFEVWCKDSGGDWVQLADETVIGNRNIMLFESSKEFTVPETSLIRIVIKQSRWVPVLRSIQLYAA